MPRKVWSYSGCKSWCFFPFWVHCFVALPTLFLFHTFLQKNHNALYLLASSCMQSGLSRAWIVLQVSCFLSHSQNRYILTSKDNLKAIQMIRWASEDLKDVANKCTLFSTYLIQWLSVKDYFSLSFEKTDDCNQASFFWNKSGRRDKRRKIMSKLFKKMKLSYQSLEGEWVQLC